MTKNCVLRARVTPAHTEKVDRIKKEMGLGSPSEVIRLLVERAELVTRPAVNILLDDRGKETGSSETATAP